MGFQIIQVVQEFGTEGGIETVAYELANAWDRAGIPNLVMASAGEEVGSSGRVRPLVPWLAIIPTRGSFRHLGRLIVIPVFELASTLALRGYRNSVVLSHGNSLSGDVVVVHALNAASLKAKQRAGRWAWRFNPLHMWVSARDQLMLGGARYRRFVAVSPSAAADLEEYYKVPKRLISVIPNGIDLKKFKPDPAHRAMIRQEFGIPRDGRLLLFVGHEFDRKGLAFVIGALEHLDENVHLLVVGSDNPAPYKRLLSKGAHRLLFAGERRDLPAIYAAADAFVLPTAYETFSLVCMEAMASGVPVFATCAGGIEDYLKDGVNGYFIERNSAGIAARIRPVLENDTLLSALRAGARATAENYAWDGVAALYSALLREVWEAKASVVEAA